MEKITLRQFIAKYCKDIIEKEPVVIDLPDEMFTYDYLLETEDYGSIKIVEADDGTQIKVHDIITLSEVEFRFTYKTDEALKCYHNYLSSFRILNGEEILTYFRQTILKELKRVGCTSTSNKALEGFV